MDLTHLLWALVLGCAALAVPFSMWLRMDADIRQRCEEKLREQARVAARRANEEAVQAQSQAMVSQPRSAGVAVELDPGEYPSGVIAREPAKSTVWAQWQDNAPCPR